MIRFLILVILILKSARENECDAYVKRKNEQHTFMSPPVSTDNDILQKLHLWKDYPKEQI